jgi:hypothetical protein
MPSNAIFNKLLGSTQYLSGGSPGKLCNTIFLELLFQGNSQEKIGLV